MEGLIPYIYRSIKRGITRRRYECLSSGAAAAADTINNIQQRFLPNNQTINTHYYSNYYSDGEDIVGDDHPAAGHRRQQMSHRVEYPGGFSPERAAAAASCKSKQIGRFKCHKMFSCVTGS
ncbi:hypothetical protein DM860_005626 [Cuscuta australis]|uniref:Uncharacterized protein n=1 Tax=Cuscuta australis TaxID=267555 RepID=A0A328DRB6_9ASTE|nr:hypothetical protein DM860_005626 [Cuscuta australis]